MTGIATGVFKKVSFKRQLALGAKAPAGAAGTARYLRRTKSTIDLSKTAYQSTEILESQQRRDMRHGVRTVTGAIDGELSVGGYQQQMESVLRQGAQAPVSTGAVVTIAAAVTAGNYGTFTRSAGSFIADGFKVGDVVNCVGWAAPAVNNNAHNFLITSLTAVVMSVVAVDNTPVIAKIAGDNVTMSTVGKKIWAPASNQTRDYYTINHWFADIGVSEEFKDCVFTGFTATLPPSGMATIAIPVIGLDIDTGVAEYFNAPSPSPIGGILASVNGILLINGVAAGIVTGLTIVVNGNYTSPQGVVGQNTNPDIYPGLLDVSGSLTVLFRDTVMRDLFINETESQLSIVMTANNAPNSPFTAFNMSRIKFSGATKDDGTAGLALTMPYTALENVSTSGEAFPNLQTTLSVQDSAFV
jgi:hypothetical protein